MKYTNVNKPNADPIGYWLTENETLPVCGLQKIDLQSAIYALETRKITKELFIILISPQIYDQNTSISTIIHKWECWKHMGILINRKKNFLFISPHCMQYCGSEWNFNSEKEKEKKRKEKWSALCYIAQKLNWCVLNSGNLDSFKFHRPAQTKSRKNDIVYEYSFNLFLKLWCYLRETLYYWRHHLESYETDFFRKSIKQNWIPKSYSNETVEVTAGMLKVYEFDH